MTTATDIITGAARLIGVIRKSEALSADEVADGLVSLNDMISSWSNDGHMVVSRVRESFNISGANSYSIGAGQTLNTIRPISIITAYIRSGGIDYSMDIISDEQYESIGLKSVNSPFPDYLTYDNAYPYGTIRFFPLLNPSGELHLMSEKAISSFSSLSSTVDFPPGWNKALRYNLAMEMAPEYGIEPSQTVARQAAIALASIQLAIAKNRPIKFTPKQRMRGSIYTGWLN